MNEILIQILYNLERKKPPFSNLDKFSFDQVEIWVNYVYEKM